LLLLGFGPHAPGPCGRGAVLPESLALRRRLAARPAQEQNAFFPRRNFEGKEDDMGMAMKLAHYLRAHPVQFDLLMHSHTGNSLQSAKAMHVPPGCLAKAVVLEDDDAHMLMAVLPASRKLDLEQLRSRTGRTLRLATEAELGECFDDCALGAVPPIGKAYGMETVLDDSLMAQPELYFEAGDHETLVRVKTSDFASLLEGAAHMDFSAPHEEGSRPLF
jgi:Ala-tRNA(Pro) deacylase